MLKLNGKYNIIFDVVGKTSFSHGLDMLNKNGKYLLVNFKMLFFNHEKIKAKKGSQEIIL